MSQKLRSVVGAIAVAACAFTACGGDGKSSDTTIGSPSTTGAPADVLETAAMVPAIQAVLELGASSSSTGPDLTACPLGDFDAMVAKAPAEVAARASIDDSLETYVYQPSGPNEPPHLQCGRGELGAYTGLPPEADYRDELVRLLPDFIVTFDDDSTYLGGTIVRFCADPIGVGFSSFCEADWYDDNVWVGVFIFGESESGSTTLAEQWLVAILGDVVANVPLLAPTVQLAV
ncbi:MAG: hypothetical protein ABL953_02160 [Ilumatobacteraceae bacterium]